MSPPLDTRPSLNANLAAMLGQQGGLAWRDAWRSIVRFPTTSLASVFILALTMAVGVVTFAVVDTIVLRPLPYPDSDTLIDIAMRTQKTSRGVVSPVDYFAWREHTSSFEALAAWSGSSFQIADDRGSEALTSVIASASLFQVLRARPLIGTLFSETHESPGLDTVALISEGLWERRYGRDPAVVGTSLALPSGPVTIIGVMPQGFVFPVEAQSTPAIWRPYAPRPEERVFTPASGRSSYLRVIGRRKDGATIEQTRADVERVFSAQAAQHPDLYEDNAVRTERLQDVLTERFAGWMRLVLASVAMLMAIGCVNVANLLLTRSAQRARDVSIRLSLGATRTQLMATALLESSLLALGATLSGLVAASWLLTMVKAALPPGIVRAEAVSVDGRVFLACAVAAGLTALIAGLLPGWQATRVAPAQVLKDGSSGTSAPRSRRSQEALLVLQVALVITLVAGSTLLVSSFARVLGTDLGFSQHDLAGIQLAPSIPRGPSYNAEVQAFYDRVEDAVRGVPGVASVATVAGGPLPLYTGASVTRLSSPDANKPPVPADLRRVSPGYFETAGIRLVEGRGFAESDRGKLVAVIDELGAKHLFEDQSALGRRLSTGGLTVIGVAANVKLLGPEAATQPQLYMPLVGDSLRVLLVRTSTPIEGIAPAIHAAVTSVTQGKPRPVKVEVVDDQFRVLTADRRFNAAAMSGLGVVALLIAASGIWATTAATVTQQRKEIGIRMALGASAARVVRGITGSTGRLLGIGALLGMVGAWSTARVLESVAFQVRSTDAVVYLVPLILITGGGIIATLLPALKAARVNPLETLRSE